MNEKRNSARPPGVLQKLVAHVLDVSSVTLAVLAVMVLAQTLQSLSLWWLLDAGVLAKALSLTRGTERWQHQDAQDLGHFFERKVTSYPHASYLSESQGRRIGK